MPNQTAERFQPFGTTIFAEMSRLAAENNASEAVVAALIAAYPDGAKEKDSVSRAAPPGLPSP